LRDELKVKAHLAKADVQDEWNKLESRFQNVESDLKQSSQNLKQPLDAIAQNTRDLVRELKVSFDNFKRRLDT
jgi:hypothetical protein